MNKRHWLWITWVLSLLLGPAILAQRGTADAARD